MMIKDIRCPDPQCNRLLARTLSDGSLEIVKRGRTLATVKCGTITCPRCGETVQVAGHPLFPPPYHNS